MEAAGKFGGSIDKAWDFYGCREAPMLTSPEARERLEQCIKDAGFTFVASCFYRFKTDGEGYSFVSIIGESHVAIHTWPEKQALELTIHYCNYTQNNDDKAETLIALITELFKPASVDPYEKRIRCLK